MWHNSFALSLNFGSLGEESKLCRLTADKSVYNLTDFIPPSNFSSDEEFRLKSFKVNDTLECHYYEISQRSGEIIFVPSGWHHQVSLLRPNFSLVHLICGIIFRLRMLKIRFRLITTGSTVPTFQVSFGEDSVRLMTKFEKKSLTAKQLQLKKSLKKCARSL